MLLRPTIKECCTTSYLNIWLFLEEHGFEVIEENGRTFAIRLGTVPVLGVCHADTVLSLHDSYEDQGAVIWSPELDDRLGMAMHLILSQSIDYSILVCDDEEIGQSTAEVASNYLGGFFNWVFEFDRRGTDAVTYEYSSPEWDSIIGSFFPDIGYGSFSDVCSLDLGVKALNVACGYYREHTKQCYCVFNEVTLQMSRMARMLRKLSMVKIEHKEDEPIWTGRSYSSFTDYKSADYKNDEIDIGGYQSSYLDRPAVDEIECKACGDIFSEDDLDYGYCPSCFAWVEKLNLDS